MNRNYFYCIVAILFASCGRLNEEANHVEKCDSKMNEEYEHINEKEIKTNQEHSNILPSEIKFELDEFYKNSTISNFSKNQFAVNAHNLIMGFDIISDTLILANNNYQKIQFIKISKNGYRLIKEIHYPAILDTLNPVSDLIVINDSVYCANFHGSFISNLNTETTKVSKNTFSKNFRQFLRVFDKSKIIGFNSTVYNILSEMNLPDIGIDIGCNKNGDFFILEISHDGIYLTTSEDNRKRIILGRDMKNLDSYSDIDIVSINSDHIKFVLKSITSTYESDLLINYNLIDKKSTSLIDLKTLNKTRTQLGDPLCFLTGTKYIIRNNRLWRIRTTIDELLLESWDI